MFSHPGRTVVVILVWLLIVLKVPSSSRLADTPGSIIISKGFPITIYIVAGILVAFCFFDGWSCKRSCILHRRFQQFPRCHGTRFDPYMNKRYRFFSRARYGFFWEVYALQLPHLREDLRPCSAQWQLNRWLWVFAPHVTEKNLSQSRSLFWICRPNHFRLVW